MIGRRGAYETRASGRPETIPNTTKPLVFENCLHPQTAKPKENGSSLLQTNSFPDRGIVKQTDRVRLNEKMLKLLAAVWDVCRRSRLLVLHAHSRPSGAAGRSPPNVSILERLHLVSLPRESASRLEPLSVSRSTREPKTPASVSERIVPLRRSRIQALALMMPYFPCPRFLPQSYIPILCIKSAHGNCKFQWIFMEKMKTRPRAPREAVLLSLRRLIAQRRAPRGRRPRCAPHAPRSPPPPAPRP